MIQTLIMNQWAPNLHNLTYFVDPQCSKNHPMVEAKTGDFWCDLCDKEHICLKSGIRWRCFECDEDFCFKCVPQGNHTNQNTFNP